MYVQQQIHRPFEGNLKLHQQHFLLWQVMLQQLLRLSSSSANLSNQFFKTPSSFRGEPPVPPKLPMTESVIVVIHRKRAVSVEIIVIVYSRLGYNFFSSKDVSL